MGRKKKQEEVTEEQLNSDIKKEEETTKKEETTKDVEKPKKKKKKKHEKKLDEISELTNINDKKEESSESSEEKPKKKKKKKKEEKEEVNNIEETSNESINNNEDLYAPLGDKTFTKNEGVSEDLYAPFGDKTFTKDELLDKNTSISDSVSENNIEQSINDIDIDRIKNDNEYLEHLDADIIKENIKQKKSPEEQNEFDLQMIKNYMGKKYVDFTKPKFNIYACIFGSLYLMFRKMYLYGISLYLFSLLLIMLFMNNIIILGIVILLIICIHIILGVTFNKIYLNRSYNQVKKIEETYNANQDDFVLSECKFLGGTDIAKTIIIVVVIGIVVIYSILQIDNFLQY